MEAPTVLIVDDQIDNLHVLGELLRPHYRVIVATSGARALKLAAEQPPPDLLLLDVNMPEMDGFQVLQKLQDDASTRAIPVVFLTARDAAVDEEQGLTLGAVDYITKPMNPATVLARVKTQVSLKRARDALQAHNRSLEAEVAERMRDNQAIQDVSIRALARLAEIRDPETGNHILRTQEYVRELGMRMTAHPRYAGQIDARQVILISKSAPLHDIGKVGIPDAILLKPGKLTEAEWGVMRTHAALGAQAIERALAEVGRGVDFLRYAKEIAHWHHERWDGTGYPDRLTGDAIPLAARLMALADVFDALISRRVYKDPMAPETARAIIAAQRGGHFDPDLVDLFLEGFDAFVDIAERHADEPGSVGGTSPGFRPPAGSA